jgi:hypothetical protein
LFKFQNNENEIYGTIKTYGLSSNSYGKYSKGKAMGLEPIVLESVMAKKQWFPDNTNDSLKLTLMWNEWNINLADEPL